MPASVNKVGLISLVLSNSAGLGHSFRALCTTSLDTWLAREIRQELYSRYVGQHVVIPGKRRWVNRPSPEYGRRITALGSSLAAASPKSGGNGDPPEIKREPIEISSGTQLRVGMPESSSGERAERSPFDLEVALFLASFAFQAYKDPEDTVWEVECEKSSVVQFGDGGLAAKAFPGLLTVSLLTTEGLAMVDVREAAALVGRSEAGAGENGKQERPIEPCVTMVVSDKRMTSETKASQPSLTTRRRRCKRRDPRGRQYWGDVLTLPVHDPKSSVLEVGLWDEGDRGAWSTSAATKAMPNIFGTSSTLIATARIPLQQVLFNRRIQLPPDARIGKGRPVDGARP